MPLLLTIALPVFLSNSETQCKDTHRFRSVSPIPYLMMKYLRTAGWRNIEKQNRRQMERASELSLVSGYSSSLLCIVCEAVVVVTSGDNI